MKSKLYRLTVLGIEQTLKMKFFVILNVLMLVASIAFVNFDSVKQIIAKSTGNNLDEDILKVMVVDDTGRFTKYMQDNKVKNMEIVDYSNEGINEDKVLVEIKNDEQNIINVKITSNEYIDEKDYSEMQTVVNEIRADLFAEKYGAQLTEVKQLTSDVQINRVILKVNMSDFVKYEGIITVITFIMYMLFIFVAATISSTIGVEKISRTTEYMLTGMSEKAYLWYNILQVNIVFIIQMLLSGVYYILGTIINKILAIKFLGATVAESGGIVGLNMDPIIFKIIVLTVIQTVLCVLILSIIQAIMTSKVNNMTDISNSSMLVIMLVILVCFVAPQLIPVSETVNIFIKIVSCLPVFSIVMVPKLMLLHQIGNIGIILSVIVNVVALFILSIFGSRWFKKGLLGGGSSSKTDRRKKDEIYDMQQTKFKEVLFKISVAMLIYFVISNVLGLAGILIKTSWAFSQNIQSGINIIIWILSILPSYLYLKPSYVKNKKEEKKEDRKNDKKTSMKERTTLVLMGLFVVAAVQYILSLLTSQGSNVDITELLGVNFNSRIQILLFTLNVAILPAIFEELLFRKAILTMLSKYGNVAAILISSVCFGLIHQNLTQGVFAFFMGIVLSFITLKTKSIIPAMIIHFLNNFVAVESTIAVKTNNVLLSYGIIALIILVTIVAGICLFINIFKNRKIFILEKTEVKIKNVFSSIFTQYIVLITIFLYAVVSIYMQMTIF